MGELRTHALKRSTIKSHSLRRLVWRAFGKVRHLRRNISQRLSASRASMLRWLFHRWNRAVVVLDADRGLGAGDGGADSINVSVTVCHMSLTFDTLHDRCCLCID